MRIRALSVTELNRYIKKILINDPILNNIVLKGEISNLKYHGSGHVYLSLKDENSKINCVMFRENSVKLKFQAENGMKVVVKGYVSTFERDGQYQMYIKEMEPQGIGAHYLAFEQLKTKLEKEGVFDPLHKKKIPFFAKNIAVITSPTGAAIRDIISVVKRRNHYVDVLIYPVLVQGEKASAQIAEAIYNINEKFRHIDLIILARGGGSIEELWAFNEEIVAKSIYHSNIPIISAIGHETDFTISDFAADLRAPTPSAAAEIAVFPTIDMKNKLDSFIHKMNMSVAMVLSEKRNKLKVYSKEKMSASIQYKMNEQYQVIDMLKKDLLNSARIKVETYKGILLGNISKLEGINPFSTILRGYAIVLEKDQSINSIEEVNIGDSINILLKDGMLSCNIIKKKKEDNIFESYYKETK